MTFMPIPLLCIFRSQENKILRPARPRFDSKLGRSKPNFSANEPRQNLIRERVVRNPSPLSASHHTQFVMNPAMMRDGIERDRGRNGEGGGARNADMGDHSRPNSEPLAASQARSGGLQWWRTAQGRDQPIQRVHRDVRPDSQFIFRKLAPVYPARPEPEALGARDVPKIRSEERRVG